MNAAGTWQVQIATPVGVLEVRYVFATQDGVLQGHATQGQETTELTEVTSAGERLSWVQQMTRPMKLKLRFEVTVAGDQMIGTARAAPLPGSKVTGTRSG